MTPNKQKDGDAFQSRADQTDGMLKASRDDLLIGDGYYEGNIYCVDIDPKRELYKNARCLSEKRIADIWIAIPERQVKAEGETIQGVLHIVYEDGSGKTVTVDTPNVSFL